MNETCSVNDGEVPNMNLLLRIGANGVQPVPYTNYKGETAIRNIMPVTLYYGSNEWHPEEQWLLIAWDSEKKALRTFALKGFEEGAKKLAVEKVVDADLPKEVGTAVPKTRKKSTRRRGSRDSLEDE